MCTWDGTGASPDRMDAMVWAITELMGYARAPGGDEPRVYRYTDELVDGPGGRVVRWPENLDEWLQRPV